MPFAQVRLCDLETVIGDVRDAGAGYPTQRKVRTLFSELYAYAVSHDLCVRDYSRYVEIDRPKKRHRKQPFTVRQRNRLWRGVDEMPEARLVLMLIYSGCRIGEFLRIKRADVNLRTRFIRITASKTESGKRLVPSPNVWLLGMLTCWVSIKVTTCFAAMTVSRTPATLSAAPCSVRSCSIFA